ncbi:hypothetical protein QVD17_32431 [Tagetes erecta]|uniref:protein-serine/threonine phosphatase n=1 Tax=Tagetes erecta TaxID=13708 RepID=A0AAD8NKS8_TARER|nr:hypothetical protein QVD17_32431 [Tagetes erecta]
MVDDLMNLLSICWKSFVSNSNETNGSNSNSNSSNSMNNEDAFEKDGLLWHRDIGEEYSMAVVQANQVLEDQSQIVSCSSFGTFVGVYDGHGGPHAARYVCDNLYNNLQAQASEGVTADTIENAFLETDKEFTGLVSELFKTHPAIATVGTCCLVGLIYHQTLFIANAGDSRAVLAHKLDDESMGAIQVSTEHNANLEEVREQLKNAHPHDPQIVAFKNGVWRVKGIIQVSRSIGDVYMKHAKYNNNSQEIAEKFRLPESTVMPILSATPSIITHQIHSNDSFVIFASDGLWEHLTNEEAVEIVHKNPRSGIAKRVVKAALEVAAKKREMRYSDLNKIHKGVRRHFHDDITVIVLFLNYHQTAPNVSIRSALDQF